jgi:hypothetical protein
VNCKRYLALLHEFVDCTLPQDIQNDIHAHMEACPRCKVFFKTYTMTITLSRKAENTCSISEDQFDRLRDLLASKLCKK